jgi:SP family facilitated glucose transporter-like MFS transporter 1
MSYKKLHGRELSAKDANFHWSLAVGLFSVGGMVGGLAGGWCADRFGRKRGLLLNNILLVVGAAFLTFAKHSGVFYLFQLGRFIIGVNTGFGFFICENGEIYGRLKESLNFKFVRV